MQPRSADHFFFILIEYAVMEVLAEIELTTALAQVLQSVVDWGWLYCCPRRPRSQMELFSEWAHPQVPSTSQLAETLQYGMRVPQFFHLTVSCRNAFYIILIFA